MIFRKGNLDVLLYKKIFPYLSEMLKGGRKMLKGPAPPKKKPDYEWEVVL